MKVALVGTARDVALYLPHILFIIDEIRNRCLKLWPRGRFSTIFFENDSSDNTHALLSAWCAQRDDALLMAETSLTSRFPNRTHRLAHARSRILNHLRSKHADSDRVVVMDLDDVCVELDVDNFMSYLKSDFEGVSVKCANSEPQHTDIFALRGLLAPQDSCITTSTGEPDWGACNTLDKHGIDPEFLDASRTNFKVGQPVRVKSCFNHMAIYNGKTLLQKGVECMYSGHIPGSQDREECEHVPLNVCLMQYGSVQVEPSFSVTGLNNQHGRTAHRTYRDLAYPISSRHLPHMPHIFSWAEDYLTRDTEDHVPPGYFRQRWNPAACWVWVRSHSPGKPPEAYDLFQFAQDILPILQRPIVLLTGDGDISIPSELPEGVARALLTSPMVACWLTQNCDSPGAHGGKLQAMPIGLDYKLQNKRLTIKPKPRPFNGRVVMDGHLVGGNYSETAQRRHPTQLSRQDVSKAIKSYAHVICPEQRMERDKLHDLWESVDYVVCCEGNGMDTHRAWEVLSLNRIPIVYKTPMTESLYRGLPVILTTDLPATVAGYTLLAEKAKTLPKSSSVSLTASFWLGRAAGRGAAPMWSTGTNSYKSIERKFYQRELLVLVAISTAVFFFVMLMLVVKTFKVYPFVNL